MRAFRQAVEARDIDAGIALFADDATLDSPVAFKPFVGRAQIDVVLHAIIETFSDFRYTHEFENEDGSSALVFETKVGDKAVQGLDLITTDAEGRISNLTVMIRPLSGLIALAEAMGPKVGHLSK